MTSPGPSSSVATPSASRLRSERRAALLTLIALFAITHLSIVLFAPHAASTSEASDQNLYHYPVIQTMVEQWPAIDLVHYQSTTSPGYHLVMAGVASVLGDELTVLQLVSSLGTLAMLIIVWWPMQRRLGGWTALAWTAPLIVSSYVIGASAWLTTDNWAWAFVALALGGAIFNAPTAAALASWGIAATAAVFIRQVHLWVAGAPWLAALFVPAAMRWRSVPAWIPMLLPFALMATFYVMWDGLTPPAFRDKHNVGMNPASLCVILSLVAAYGVWFMPAWLPSSRRALPRHPLVWGVAIVVLIFSVLIETTYAPKPDGRWGGVIWEFVRRAPSIGTTSLVLPVTSMAGVLVIGRAIEAARAHGRARGSAILVLALAGFSAAQMMNSMAWQRYVEPLVLMAVAWLSVLALAPQTSETRRARLGPVILAGGLLLLSGITVYRPVFLGS